MNRLRARMILAIVAASCLAMHAIAQQSAPRDQPPQALVPQGTEPMAEGDAAFAREDWQAAVDAYQKARAEGNDSTILHFRMGFALHMLGRYQEALPSHLRAAGVPHPEIRIDGLYNAACAYALLGDTDKALEYLQKAVDAGFKDKSQLEKDSDMNLLRESATYKAIVASIGAGPGFFDWMDYFLGDWERPNDSGEVVESITFARPMSKSRGIVTTSTNIGGGHFTGFIWPDPETRTWRWTCADGIGTTRQLIGTPSDNGGMTFTGNDFSAAGADVHLRLTFTPLPDGRVREVVEVSADGMTWRAHHEARYVLRSEPGMNADDDQ